MSFQTNITNLSDKLFFNLKYYNYEAEGDTLCEACAKYDRVGKMADCGGDDWGYDMDLCTDCYHDMSD